MERYTAFVLVGFLGNNHHIPCGNEYTLYAGLHLACLCGSNKSVKALLSSGANPNLPDTAQQTPIFLAAQNGYGDCMQLVRVP